MKERLQWVEEARVGLLTALGDDLMSPAIFVIPTADPLKFILKINLVRPVQQETREPLRTYIRCIAKMGGCELPIIRIEDHYVQAEILIGARHWNRDAKGKFLGPGRFKPKENDAK